MLLKGRCHRRCVTKALDLGLKPCVVINKVDKENCTPEEVHEKVLTNV
jgi:GTP-binding protein